MKMLGVGLTLAILVDTTLIRAVFMPAAMRLMGSANWWARNRNIWPEQSGTAQSVPSQSGEKRRDLTARDWP